MLTIQSKQRYVREFWIILKHNAALKVGSIKNFRIHLILFLVSICQIQKFQLTKHKCQQEQKGGPYLVASINQRKIDNCTIIWQNKQNALKPVLSNTLKEHGRTMAQTWKPHPLFNSNFKILLLISCFSPLTKQSINKRRIINLCNTTQTHVFTQLQLATNRTTQNHTTQARN